MILPAFDGPGRFFRGNLHTHSTLSDGVLEPAEVCRRYKAEGYDFIALTDHMIGLFGYPVADTRAFRDEGFTTLFGAELHSGAMANGELWHILAVGLPRDFKPANAPDFRARGDQESGPAIAARARKAGAFVAVAHPQWSGMTLDDARSIEAAHAVEIYNHGCLVGCDRPDGFQIADLLASEGRDLTVVATDDAHFCEPDHFGGWVMVRAEKNEPEELLASLKAGHFYSSQGPQIYSAEIVGEEAIVECSAAASIMAQGHGSAATVLHGEALTRAHLKLGRVARSPWIRLTVVDRAGKRAWTNPVRMDGVATT